MENKELNLSEKIKNLFEVEYLDIMSDVQGDVTILFKEFIKKLKFWLKTAPTAERPDPIPIIDILAGDELI